MQDRYRWAGLDYLSSDAVGVLIGVVGPIQEKGGDLRLAAFQGLPKMALELLGLATIFSMHPSTVAAAASFEPQLP